MFSELVELGEVRETFIIEWMSLMLLFVGDKNVWNVGILFVCLHIICLL